MRIENCDALSSAIPSYAWGHMQHLEELEISRCSSMKDVFEIKRVVVNDVTSSTNNNNIVSSSSTLTTNTTTTTCITIPPDLRNLKRLEIFMCPLLRDVFPFSTLQSLTRLEYLDIAFCDDIRVVVKEEEEEDGNHTTSSSSSDDHQVPVVFPCLKTMVLVHLPNVESFFLGTNGFQWPVLDTVVIRNCPKMRMFTKGDSDSPILIYVTSDVGKHSVEGGKINNLFHHHHHTATSGASLQQEEDEVPYPSLDASTSLPLSQWRMPWCYHHLTQVHASGRDYQRFIFGRDELQHMQKIEKIKILLCSGVKGIFETFETNRGLNQTHSVLEVREMDFMHLSGIKCLWKSKQWTVLKFPNLTRLTIDCCGSLRHVFTISMVASLLQLQDLHISYCQEMEIVLADVEKEDEDDEKEQNDDGKEDEGDDERRVNEDHENKEKDEEDDDNDSDSDKTEHDDETRVNKDDNKEEQDDDETRVNEVEFPCLRSLSLRGLMSLKGFCLGMETIHWPSLDTLEIIKCPKITTFTNGQSTTPKLKLIETSFGLCDATEDVNSFIRTKIEEGFEFGE